MATIEFIDPPELHEPVGYRHAARADGGWVVYTAGQVSVDGRGEVLDPGDHAAQSEQAMLHVVAALAGAGAGVDDVVKLTFYVVGLGPDTATQVHRGLGRAMRSSGLARVPATMVGIVALAHPDLVIEIEAVAVVD